ncbi:MAG: GcrA family cell cycle regulator [Xanthobacteraceae bacterium]
MIVWTDPKIEKLRSLHRTGFSCSQIAAQLNEEFGYPHVTRNAVIGKVTRLGLTGARPKSGTSATVIVKKKRHQPTIRKPRGENARPAPKIDVLQFAKPLNGTGVPFLDRKRLQCSWLIDDATVCGQPFSEGQHFSWCPYHSSIGLVKPIKPQPRDERKRTNEHAY